MYVRAEGEREFKHLQPSYSPESSIILSVLFLLDDISGAGSNTSGGMLSAKRGRF